jgi:uncharacterized membrane protein YcaP (DUF421 family)
MDFTHLWHTLSENLGAGRDSHDVHAWQMALRALLVYIVALAIVRIGSTRFMGKSTAIDLVLAVIIGSILSRALTGNSPLVPVFAAALVLVVTHWILAAASLRSSTISRLVKGNAVILIEDGEIDRENMRRFQIGKQDLLEALRSQAKTEDPSQVKRAFLERNGEISFIMSSNGPST